MPRGILLSGYIHMVESAVVLANVGVPAAAIDVVLHPRPIVGEISHSGLWRRCVRSEISLHGLVPIDSKHDGYLIHFLYFIWPS